MSFPSGISGGHEYNLVKFNAIPNYVGLPSDFHEYVFVFATYTFNSEDKEYGRTHVEIVNINSLPCFNPHVREANQFIYEGGTLVINDFVEIIEAKNEYETKYIAVLKNQPLKIDGEYRQTQDINELLCTNNSNGIKHIKRVSPAEFSPRFQHIIDRQKKYDENMFLGNVILKVSSLKHKINNPDLECIEKVINYLEEYRQILDDEQVNLDKDYFSKYI